MSVSGQPTIESELCYNFFESHLVSKVYSFTRRHTLLEYYISFILEDCSSLKVFFFEIKLLASKTNLPAENCLQISLQNQKETTISSEKLDGYRVSNRC